MSSTARSEGRMSKAQGKVRAIYPLIDEENRYKAETISLSLVIVSELLTETSYVRFPCGALRLRLVHLDMPVSSTEILIFEHVL